MSKKLAGIMAVVVEATLKGHLAPKLAMDANINLGPVVKGITPENYTDSKARIASDVKKLVEGKLAQDAEVTEAEVKEVLDSIEDNKQEVASAVADASDGDDDGDDDMGEDEDMGDNARAMEFLKSKLSAEDLASLEKILGGDNSTSTGDDDTMPSAAIDEALDKRKLVSKPAMDAAISVEVKKAEQALIQRQRDIRQAEKDVLPHIGEVDGLAMDSASDIYKLALDAKGVDTKGVDSSAFPAMVKMLNTSVVRPVNKMAMDESSDKKFTERFGSLSHIKRR